MFIRSAVLSNGPIGENVESDSGAGTDSKCPLSAESADRGQFTSRYSADYGVVLKRTVWVPAPDRMKVAVPLASLVTALV